ncbi:hypothetical protein BOTBODRAFT_322305 [Botryobasidium botryosum FD-172 SS1]|uniref:Uncharacterized protein n=1 Tax=Botryobasidium botryosum (strain FD-172 SS1) TaxID=930990 RepID=A0A067N1U5_BOTB1|nr:hypothetical protein BOTBODRAFT_322305 [Botryobasidium botryosum FD-172 SS1]
MRVRVYPSIQHLRARSRQHTRARFCPTLPPCKVRPQACPSGRVRVAVPASVLPPDFDLVGWVLLSLLISISIFYFTLSPSPRATTLSRRRTKPLHFTRYCGPHHQSIGRWPRRTRFQVSTHSIHSSDFLCHLRLSTEA